MRQSNSSATVLVVIVLFAILAPVLYVVSIGPVIWLSERGLINTDEGSAAVIIYTPLICAAESSPTAEAAFTWYASLFAAPQPPQPVIYGPITPATSPSTYYDPSVPHDPIAPPGTISPTRLAAPGTVPGPLPPDAASGQPAPLTSAAQTSAPACR
jgi:hypothetical protein